MSNQHAIAFDTGNPLEGYGVGRPESGERSQRDPNRAAATVRAGSGCARHAGRAGAPDEMGSTATVTSQERKATVTWTLRPISPADETALIAFHERCSEGTRYLRFAAAKPQLRRARRIISAA